MLQYNLSFVTLDAGLVVGNLAAWVHGASIVYPSEGFDAHATLDAVSSERCTALCVLFPSMTIHSH